MTVAKLIERYGPYRLPGKLSISELFFTVPKDYSKPGDGALRVFARSLKRAENPLEVEEKKQQQPWLVYLQGGPGFECRSPQSAAWVNAALDKGYQMLFMDQRGTGLSSAISAATLARQGGPNEQAEYLKLFRADNIVRDCEAIRKELTKEYPEEKQKWSIIGQSFGGFCAVTYLSKFPEGLKEAFTMGGLAPLVRNPDEVYRKLYKRVSSRNRDYYRRFPEDVDRVRSLVKFIAAETPDLPAGGKLSVERFQALGLSFGAHGGADAVHEIVFRAYNEYTQLGFLTTSTLSSIEGSLHFDSNLLYAVLHEPIYCQGMAPNWSAERVKKELPQFNWQSAMASKDPVFFTGEMIYPWMFESFPELRKLKETASIVASFEDWPELYDEEQLAKNNVPVYSATYVDDMFVDFEFAQETASKIKGCKQFITNMMYHDAIRSKADEVMKQLFTLRDDVID